MKSRRPAAAGAGQHQVLVRLGLGARVLDHRRGALDDVVVVVLPHDLAGLQVDLVQLAVEARPRAGRACPCRGRSPAGRSSRCPTTGLVGVAACRPSGEVMPPPMNVFQMRESLLGRRPQAVQPPRLVAEEGADLDAVALRDDGRRRVDGRHGASRCTMRTPEAAGDAVAPAAGPPAAAGPVEPVPHVLRPAAGHEDAGGDDDEEGDDEEPPVATLTPAAQLAAALAHVDLIWRPSARTVCAHDAHSVPGRRRANEFGRRPKAFPARGRWST